MGPTLRPASFADVQNDAGFVTLEVSIIVAARNEARSLPDLTRRVVAALEDDRRTFEIVVVDDGSTDDSRTVLNCLQSDEPRIRPHILDRHHGKSAALSTGLRTARGRLAVFMDADLQDVPEEVPSLLAALEEGPFDLIQAYRSRRHDASPKVLASWIFNQLCWAASGLKLRDVNCGMKAFHLNQFEDMHLSKGQHRFVPVLAHRRGLRIGELAVRHARRVHGRSRYGWRRYLEGIQGLITDVLFPRLRPFSRRVPTSQDAEAPAILAPCHSRPILSRSPARWPRHASESGPLSRSPTS